MKTLETAKPITYRSLLLQAAEVIRKHGHCPDRATGPRGELCIMAALGEARNELRAVGPELYTQTLCAIQKQIGGNCPVTWNYSQNADSVIKMLERAALG